MLQQFLKGFQIQNISKNFVLLKPRSFHYLPSLSIKGLNPASILFSEDEDSFSQPLTLTWTAVQRKNTSPTQYPLLEAPPVEKLPAVPLVDGNRLAQLNHTASDQNQPFSLFVRTTL